MATSVHAQAARPVRTWLAAGVGSASGARDGGAAIIGALVVQRQPHQFALRGLGAADVLAPDSCPFGEIGALYGRAAAWRAGHASVSSGVSSVRAPGCRPNTRWTVGMPIVAEAAVRPAPVIAIGIQGFLTLNRVATYGGVALVLQLGWMP